MLGQERIHQICDTILARSTADQTEVVIRIFDRYLTRFANSTIHQNVAETNIEVNIRVVLFDTPAGARVSSATTNDLSEQALSRTLENALDLARLQPPNPAFKSLPAPQPISEVDAFRSTTAGCTPERRAREVGVLCRLACETGLIASGAFTTAASELAVANSLGIWAYHPSTYAEINTVIMSETSAGYASALALDVNDLDFESLGREAVEKCRRSQNPRPIEPGEYCVILEPYAVEDLVQMMASTGFSALTVQEGRSFMVGKFGQQIVDPRVSIWDDGLDPTSLPIPFDIEGVPKQRVDLIEKGVARGVVYDSYRAGREEGKRSTGHAISAPFIFSPFPQNTFFAPGNATLEEMIQSTTRGLYVTRFHYTRVVEPRQVVITGMTRDGTFLIENGEIAYPVKNLRFTQSYLEALNHVAAIGRQPRLLLSDSDGLLCCSVPALKLDRFFFTGVTEF
ncbi:MAG: TldD/PmbA family protein [Anaerolineae bacterium]